MPSADAKAWNDIFDQARKACSAATWSRGVELVRADTVAGTAENDGEVLLSVSIEGGLRSFDVTLHAEDGEWECECASREDACEHVAASLIALRQARAEGKRLPEARAASGHVGYRLARSHAGLALERVIVSNGKEAPLTTTLAAIASGRIDGPRFAAKPADLEVERVLLTRLRGVLPKEHAAKILAQLARIEDLKLDGRTVKASADPIVPEARLEDQDQGFRLFVELPPGEAFANGIVLVGETLHPVGQTKLTARELEELSVGRHFAPDEVSKLVTEVLPSLTARVPFENRTKRLPKTSADPPRIMIDARREGETLSVFATLVYGDPPRARVDGGRLVLLGGTVPFRDVKAEERLVRGLGGRLGLIPGREEQFAAEAAVRFAARLENFDGDVRGRGHEHFFEAPAVLPKLEIDGERFDVSFESAGDRVRQANPSAVLRAWRDGASMAPLVGGGYAPIPREWLERFGHTVADLLAAREGSGRVSTASLPDLAELADALGVPPPPRFERLKAVAEGFSTIPPAELPGDLAATLRTYQRAGVDWLSFLGDTGLGAMLADDMGLGKTLQALCALRGRALVVAPTSVVRNWENEIRRFRPALRASVYHGPARRLDPEADVTLTSYAILRLDQDALAAERWQTVVLDEAQMIKNPESQVARAAHRLAADFRVTLSGTPVENRLSELWSQFHFLNPGLLGGRDDFEERYARPIAAGDARAAERLRRRIRPFVLRRMKREVEPELPPRTEVVLRCELSEAERRVYDTVRAAARKDVVERLTEGGNVLAALEALLRLRQAASHSALVPGEHADSSAKIELLLEELDTLVSEGHKALVFSQWTGFLDLIEPHLAKQNLAFARLDGSTRDRDGVVRRFQDDAEVPVMLISLKAGGVGLNLTAADYVFLLDPWWNPAVEDQAADRAHRIGQTRPVIVHRLVADDTVEDKILALQERKRGLADAALAGAASAISREELLQLLD